MPDFQSVESDYNLWVLLSQACNLILNVRDNELSQYGTSAMQAAILLVIKSIGDEVTPAEISRWILRKPSSVTGILQRMEKAGLLKKTKDLSRKNLVRVTTTEKGGRVYNQSLKRESIRQIMSCLSVDESQQLMASLKKL